MTNPTFLTKTYPELTAGGFTRYDGTIEFYGRINSLLRPDFTVLDFGAGRAAWHEDDQCQFRRELRLLKGKVKKVVGQDLDPAVLVNRSIDEAVVTVPNVSLPFEPASFDLVVADFVFEHVDEPDFVASEITRILRPGGWLCSRTPNKWGYISIATRLIKNSRHASILTLAQPGRKNEDVFPTKFQLNTMSDVSRYFPPDKFENYSYYYQAEPSYYFNSRIVLAGMRGMDRLLPAVFWSSLFLFFRRK